MILLDSRALVWWVAADRRLTTASQRAIRVALRSGPVLASAISVVEIATPARRRHLALTMPVKQWLLRLRTLSEIRFEPVTAEIAALAGSFDGAMPGDPADRIIAATARVHRARIVTAEEKLRALRDVVTVW